MWHPEGISNRSFCPSADLSAFRKGLSSPCWPALTGRVRWKLNHHWPRSNRRLSWVLSHSISMLRAFPASLSSVRVLSTDLTWSQMTLMQSSMFRGSAVNQIYAFYFYTHFPIRIGFHLDCILAQWDKTPSKSIIFKNSISTGSQLLAWSSAIFEYPMQKCKMTDAFPVLTGKAGLFWYLECRQMMWPPYADIVLINTKTTCIVLHVHLQVCCSNMHSSVQCICNWFTVHGLWIWTASYSIVERIVIKNRYTLHKIKNTLLITHF